MISLKAFKQLERKFSKTSSWTIWVKPENNKWNSKSNISNLDCFKDTKELLKKLNNNYIFVGYNPAKHKATSKI